MAPRCEQVRRDGQALWAVRRAASSLPRRSRDADEVRRGCAGARRVGVHGRLGFTQATDVWAEHEGQRPLDGNLDLLLDGAGLSGRLAVDVGVTEHAVECDETAIPRRDPLTNCLLDEFHQLVAAHGLVVGGEGVDGLEADLLITPCAMPQLDLPLGPDRVPDVAEQVAATRRLR